MSNWNRYRERTGHTFEDVLVIVLDELLAFREETRRHIVGIHHTLGDIMATEQELFDAVARADARLDAAVTVINSTASLVADIRDRLTAIRTVPSPEQVDAVIKALDEKGAALDASIANLSSVDATVPAATPAPAPEPAPAPVSVDPAPVVSVDPAPAPAQAPVDEVPDPTKVQL